MPGSYSCTQVAAEDDEDDWADRMSREALIYFGSRLNTLWGRWRL